MRISTIQAFNNGVNGIQRNYSDVTRTHEQITTGKKILTPSDDPVGAVRLLQLEKEQGMLTQYAGNLSAAKNSLTQEESALQSITNVMQRVRELAVGAGNGALSQTERNAIAVELREREEELMGLMNSKNARGEYLFGGFQGKTAPYEVGADGAYKYVGDEGQRKVQIASSQELAITDNGKQIFDRIINGSRLIDSVLERDAASTLQMGAPLVTDEVAVAEFPPGGIEIVFRETGADAPRTYDIYNFPYEPGDQAIGDGKVDELADKSDTLVFKGVSVIFDGTPVGGERFRIGNPAVGNVPGGQAFVTDMNAFLTAHPSGQLTGSIVAGATDTFELQIAPPPAAGTGTGTMSFSSVLEDYPLSVSINGATIHFDAPPKLPDPPATGVAVTIGSTTNNQRSQGLLNSVAELRKALESGADSNSLRDSVASALVNFDNGMKSVDSAQGAIGARLNVIDTTLTSNEDLTLLNKSITSSIQDLDYAEALSRLSFQSVILEAAQQSYVKISSLTLFNKI